MRCCDQELNTPFCPQCGTKHNPPTLESLIAYLQGNLAKWEGAIPLRQRRYATAMAKGQNGSKRLLGQIRAAEKMVDRYRVWIKILTQKERQTGLAA